MTFMNFEDWIVELRRLAAPFIERGQIREDYLNPKSWRDYFEDGLTPAGAWADDMRYSEELNTPSRSRVRGSRGSSENLNQEP
jgi:hypothetical protein